MALSPASLVLLCGTLSTSAFAIRNGNSTKQGMMRTVDVYHMMMCWGKQQLTPNEECLDWMVKQCKVASTSQGYCQKLNDLVVTDCDAGKELACSRAVQLGLRSSNKAGKQTGKQTSSQASETENAHHGLKVKAETKVRVETKAKAPAPAPGPAATPGASPAASPASSPAASPGAEEEDELPHTGISKTVNGVPPQGFNEYSPEESIKMDDLSNSAVGDWQKEWPQSRLSERETEEKICKKNPKLAYCKLKLQRANLKYAATAPKPTKEPGFAGFR